MLAVSLACIMAVLLEELFLRRSRLRFMDSREFGEESLPPGLQARMATFRTRYRFIRVVQFVVFGLLWILAGEVAGARVLSSPLGQLTTTLLLLQVIRVLGRRVVRSWPLLTVTGFQQSIQAILVAILARGAGPSVPAADPLGFLYGLSIVCASVAAAVAFSSAAVYFARRSPAGARLFGEEPPPLSASETIGRRGLSIASAILLPAIAACIMGLAGNGGSPAGCLAVPSAALLICVFALLVCSDRRRFHHPAGMAAALLPYPLLITSMVSGLTSNCF